MNASRLRNVYLLSIVIGIFIAAILISYASLITTHTKTTHWVLELFSPSKSLYKKFMEYLARLPQRVRYRLTNTSSIITIYLILPGKSIDKMVKQYSVLRQYISNTSIVVLPFGLNKSEIMKSLLLLCILSKNRSIIQNVTLLNKTIENIIHNETKVLRNYSECKYVITNLNIERIVDVYKDIARSILMYGLLNKTIAVMLSHYVSGYTKAKPPLIYVVCNLRNKICVAATVNELPVVYRNVQTQIPFGYG